MELSRFVSDETGRAGLPSAHSMAGREAPSRNGRQGTPEAGAILAEHFAAGDNTRRLHLGSLRSPSVRLAGVAPELNAGRLTVAFT